MAKASLGSRLSVFSEQFCRDLADQLFELCVNYCFFSAGKGALMTRAKDDLS